MTKKLALQVKIKGDKKWYKVTCVYPDIYVIVSAKNKGCIDWSDISGFRSTNPKLFEKK